MTPDQSRRGAALRRRLDGLEIERPDDDAIAGSDASQGNDLDSFPWGDRSTLANDVAVPHDTTTSALRHISAAVRSIDKAKARSKDPATHKWLDEARATSSARLSLSKAAPAAGNGQFKPAASCSVRAVDADPLLVYVRDHPGERGEQIAKALGTSSTAMRPMMRKLIESKQVGTKGERRAMTEPDRRESLMGLASVLHARQVRRREGY